MTENNLIRKYNVPGPRYTSYPTVPYWEEENFTTEKWIKTLQKSFEESNDSEGISIYIHLPFCESLCTFCACNKRITKRHEVEEPYINSLLREWEMYLNLLPEKPKIKELHLGGGTPTFFSPENLKKLLEKIFSGAIIMENPEFSIEGHPNNTTREHMQVLYDLGFRRISFGVQDYDLKVQKAINRVQPFEHVERATKEAREIGYNSISHDLIFGLPFQTLEGMIDTINKTKELQPDRIAFYSYAHVPWIKGIGQRGFDEKDLPSGEEKRRLYEEGKKLLEDLEYKEIGMDHFAMEHDSLYQSIVNKTMHRNFMGYTSSKTQVMISLGVSSISDSWYSFAQNLKTVEEYTAALQKGELPILKGHALTEKDLIVRKHILNLMCNLETDWEQEEMQFDELPQVLLRLKGMEEDDLIQITDKELKVKEKGRSFIRNVCMAFDLRMLENEPETRIFSMTI